ncbi:MAG TPA: hypothetical protein VHB25_12130 [Gemmatimonadaceae bacterium]|nr:hypothetical protein [Gemmatimonadaceae bacterium]
MTQADHNQPWAKPSGGAVDRAFLEELLARQEQLAIAREERLRSTLYKLPLAFMLWSVLVGLLLGVLYFIVLRFAAAA